MSCKNCDRSQDTGRGYYIRIGNGNVYVQACEKHFKELQTMVRAYTKQPETNIDTTEAYEKGVELGESMKKE